MIEAIPLEFISSFWVFQSAIALYKTYQAQKRFIAHQRWIDQRVPALSESKQAILIIAVKGVSTHFERFLDFSLGQDYPNYQVVFVTESTDDSAHKAIAGRIKNQTHARLIVAGKAETTGQKVHNQLAAFNALESSDQLIAFADGDLYGRTDWLRCLLLPLNLGQADFTTGYRWFIPETPSMPNRIVTLIGVAIEPFIGPNWRMCLWGGSMAMTRSVFEELEIPKNLTGSINDDARISQLARHAGKKMRYVRSVAAPSPVHFTWKSLFEFGRRQYFQLRIYQPSLWWMALAIPSLYLASLITCLLRLANGHFTMCVLIGAATALSIIRSYVRISYLRKRFSEPEIHALKCSIRSSWWLDPIMNLVHLLIILSSACGNSIVWAGIRYRVTGPQSTEISEKDI